MSSVRKATSKEHKDLLYAFSAETWDETWRCSYKRTNPTKQELADGTVYSAEESGVIQGFAIVEVNARADTKARTKKSAEVLWMKFRPKKVVEIVRQISDAILVDHPFMWAYCASPTVRAAAFEAGWKPYPGRDERWIYYGDLS